MTELDFERVGTAAIARRIVEANMYMTLATSDADGRPWASPVWYASASASELLWVSRPEARHSRNIALRPEIAIVIFDSTVPIGAAEALYLEAVAEQVAGDAVEPAIAVFSRRSQACGAGAWDTADVSGLATLRLYRATAVAQFVLGPRDERLPVKGRRPVRLPACRTRRARPRRVRAAAPAGRSVID